MQRLFQVELPEDFRPHYNLALTQKLLLVCEHQGRQARLARWGLIASPQPPKSLSTFNTRVEGIERSPIFRAAR